MDSATPPWALWPQSVRLRILHSLLTDGCSVAKLATVSREWQEAIEQHNFARIKVTLPRLASFRSMVRRNRSRVKYIWLCVELDHYSSLESYSGHDRFVSSRDFSLFTKVIRGLFRELSRWEPSGELLLDISIHSPSDSNYLLKYLTFKPDISLDDCSSLDDVEDMEKAGRTWKEWSAAGKVDTAIKNTSRLIKLEDQSPDEEALDREIEWLDRLPDVPAVTGYDRIIEHLTRQGVRKLTIFENHNRHYSRLFQEYKHARTFMPGSMHTRTFKALNRTAALGSRELEHFSASFLVDAGLFFASCKPSWTWPNLTSLTLTSPWLAPNAQADLVKMLNSAAAVACRMPKLQTVELWNGRKRLATLFQYQLKPATITWRSTWDFALLRSIIPAWEGVAHKHGAGELVVKTELLKRANIKSHGDAIHYLRLSHPVVRPISLQQIRTENKVHRIWEKMRTAKARKDVEGDWEVIN
ncbi:hypothetical protein LA080_009854 [Diaporthe eres]|nr:hypothetical protein LA080_009854 [Diaporthe eres]